MKCDAIATILLRFVIPQGPQTFSLLNLLSLLKGVFAKNEKGYGLTAKNKRF